jgi:putative flippase GtrA
MLLAKIENLLNSRPVVVQLLRFIGIGVLTTAFDFIILNLLRKVYTAQNFSFTLGESSVHIPVIVVLNIISFSCAVVHSYLWNRYWIFTSERFSEGVTKLALKLIAAGGLGLLGMGAVLLGAASQQPVAYYAWILLVFIVVEVGLWLGYGLHRVKPQQITGQFIPFLVVSIIGNLINSGVVFVGVKVLPALRLPINVDLLANLAKVCATAVSLVWNFIGYKVFVFRKRKP